MGVYGGLSFLSFIIWIVGSALLPLAFYCIQTAPELYSYSLFLVGAEKWERDVGLIYYFIQSFFCDYLLFDSALYTVVKIFFFFFFFNKYLFLHDCSFIYLYNIYNIQYIWIWIWIWYDTLYTYRWQATG